MDTRGSNDATGPWTEAKPWGWWKSSGNLHQPEKPLVSGVAGINPSPSPILDNSVTEEKRKPTLTEQREAVELLINIAIADGVVGDPVETAKQACLTLAWFERSSELIKMLRDLKGERPELFNALNDIANAFPGVRISDIRPTRQPEREYDPDDS